MTKKYKDFVEYLNKEHKEVFVAALYSKTKEEIYRIIQTLRKIDFRRFSYVSSEVKKVTAYYTDDDHISFDAVVGFVINTIVVMNDVRKETLIGFNATFTMDGILKDGLHDLTVIDIQPGDVQRDTDKILTKEFIPYISSDELDKYAEAFLMEYYPDALFDQVGVNINEVIKNMDINWEFININGGLPQTKIQKKDYVKGNQKAVIYFSSLTTDFFSVNIANSKMKIHDTNNVKNGKIVFN